MTISYESSQRFLVPGSDFAIRNQMDELKHVPKYSVIRALVKWLNPGLILSATIAVSLVISAVVTLRVSRQTVERYVFVWEEEVARNLLVHQDGQLFDRIQNQIIDLAPDVESTGRVAEENVVNLDCFASQTLQVTLYGTPAGQLQICRSPEKLLLRSLLSPVFSFGVLLGLLFVFWRLRRVNQEEAQKALGELAIRVAHDIRSPLMALKIAAESLNAKERSENSTESSDTNLLIGRASRRIAAIADDLLEQGRATVRNTTDSKKSDTPPSRNKRATETENSMPTKSIETSIREIVREKMMTTPAAVSFEIPEIRKLTSEESPRSSHDFERVISNLLQNAIDAVLSKPDFEQPYLGKKLGKTESDSDRRSVLRIRVEAVESENEISITIRDNGIGIPKDVLPKVGDIGFSFGKKNGNGVGLSSARRWARGRGGDIDIQSHEGAGTEVRLTLPRRRTQADLL